MLDRGNPEISLRRQCALLGLNRSSVYSHAVDHHPTEHDQALLNAVDEIFTATPFYGTRRIRHILALRYQILVGRDRVRGAMATLGIHAVYPQRRGQNTSNGNSSHTTYPYLLRGLAVRAPNHIWGTDITYIRLRTGWVYLAAILDWSSRYVVGFAVSAHPDVTLCRAALHDALAKGVVPEIHNSDQGSTYTSTAYTHLLTERNIQISMDGRGRCMDNIFTERLWRSVKYENVFLMGYETIEQVTRGITEYFVFYNTKRPHQSLDYKTPADVYFGEQPAAPTPM